MARDVWVRYVANSMKSSVLAAWLACAVLVLAAPAAAKPNKPTAQKKPAATASQSVGSPSEGKLVGGERIEKTKSLRLVGSLQFAVPELVELLERSADRVAKRRPGSVLTVGDLSRKGGGDVDGHRSHESGRDADVGFYFTKGGKPFLPKRFAAVDESGKVEGLPGVAFDDARNWALVEAWLTDPKGRVLQIFVARHVRARLLAHAARIGASAALRTRAAEVMIQPKKVLPHDNHFHVRIACPNGDKECENFAKRKRATKPATKATASRQRGKGQKTPPKQKPKAK